MATLRQVDGHRPRLVPAAPYDGVACRPDAVISHHADVDCASFGRPRRWSRRKEAAELFDWQAFLLATPWCR